MLGFCVFTVGCSKGFTLKINDQDVLAFGSQDSCNFITTAVLSNTLRVSWKSATPITLIITAGVPAEFDTEIISAAAKWNSSLGKNLFVVRRDNGFSNPPGSDGVNAIYWLTDWQVEQAVQQARTAVRWDVSKLQDTDVRINAKNFNFYKTGDIDINGKIHLESLLIHEFGHTFGLLGDEYGATTANVGPDDFPAARDGFALRQDRWPALAGVEGPRRPCRARHAGRQTTLPRAHGKAAHHTRKAQADECQRGAKHE